MILKQNNKFAIPCDKIKCLFFFTFFILIISCHKNETGDLLTEGTWMLDNGLFSTMRESVTFHPDEIFVMESRVTIPRYDSYVSATISGNWLMQDDEILLKNSVVDLPDDTNSLNIIQSATGKPIGAFYGYIVTQIYQYDSTLIDNTGSVRFNDLNETHIFPGEDPGQTTWIIIRLTRDSLIVDSGGDILRYYHP